jgi:transcriptional regulator with XRE-family HTH domain
VQTTQSSQHLTCDRNPVQAQGPTALRIMLGTQLQQLREARGITAQAASHVISVSRAKVSRMELGRVGVNERDIADLLTLYGVTDQHQERSFLTLVRQANLTGWWHHYSNILPSQFETYLSLERASSFIRTYEPHLVPGLLQTPHVSRTVVQLSSPGHSSEEIERRVALGNLLG